jgi:hypothetical protein
MSGCIGRCRGDVVQKSYTKDHMYSRTPFFSAAPLRRLTRDLFMGVRPAGYHTMIAFLSPSWPFPSLTGTQKRVLARNKTDNPHLSYLTLIFFLMGKKRQALVLDRTDRHQPPSVSISLMINSTPMRTPVILYMLGRSLTLWLVGSGRLRGNQTPPYCPFLLLPLLASP